MGNAGQDDKQNPAGGPGALPDEDPLGETITQARPPLPPAAAAEGTTHDRELHPPGSVLAGRYTVLGLLGRGGMGVVLAAYDARLDRRVALKLVRSRTQDGHPAGLEMRIAREGQAMARLSHPNVVSVYDSGTLQDGSLFIAMEYVEGQTLRQWRQQRPRTWREVLDAYLAAGRGLAAAHDAGMVHRDFKPDNVLIDRSERVRVTDFGLARRVGLPFPASGPALAPSPSGAWEAVVTQAGSFLGTPAYMAPELWRGEPADIRSDVFAFCVALSEALYGHRPGEGPPPAGSDVPAWIDRAVKRGLQLHPEARPRSMREVLAALEDDPALKRRALLRTTALASTVVALGGVAAWGWMRQNAPEPACDRMERRLEGIWDEAVKAQAHRAMRETGLPHAQESADRLAAALDSYASAWVEMSTATCRAVRERLPQPGSLQALREYCLERRRGQLRAFTALLTRGPDPELGGKAVEAAQAMPPLEYCADDKALMAAVPVPEDPAVRAQADAMQEQVDRLEALHASGRYKEGRALAGELLPRVEQVPYAPLQARALFWSARLQDGVGDFRGSEATLRQGLTVAARGKDLALVARAWSHLAVLLGPRQGRHQEALLLERVVDVAVESVEDDWTRASALHCMGVVLGEAGRHDEARERHQRAVELRQKLAGPEHPDVAISLNNLGYMLRVLGRFEEARAAFERAQAIWEKNLWPEHPHAVTVVYNLGLIDEALGRYGEAKEKLERMLAIREKAFGPEYPGLEWTLAELGDVLDAMGRQEEAREKWAHALAVHEKARGPEHTYQAVELTGLGRILVHLGQWPEAGRHLQSALDMEEKALGRQTPALARTLLALGELRLAEGRLAEAEATLDRALALAPPTLRADAQLMLARALWKRGRERQRAVGLAVEARAYWERLGNLPRLSEASQWLATHPMAR